MLFGVCGSCHILYSIVSYIYVSCSRSITSIKEETACYCLLVCGFCLEEFPLLLGAWDGLSDFIAALPGPSI